MTFAAMVVVVSVVFTIIYVWLVILTSAWFKASNGLRVLRTDRKLVGDTRTPPTAPVVPTFVSGPSCAVCGESIDPDEAVKVDAMIPVLTDKSLPVTLLIHFEHLGDV